VEARGFVAEVATVGWVLVCFIELCCSTLDRLFVELAKVGDGLLWHDDKIDNKPEVGLGYCLGEFVVERAKGRMENIDGEEVPIALCDFLL
jgi:hypothetical protein